MSSFFPRERKNEKKKKVPSNSNKILNPFRKIGKRKKVNDPKPNEKFPVELQVIGRGTVQTT